MNRKELEEEVGKFDLKRYKREQKTVEELRQDFVKRFSIDRILKMTIDEYAEGKGIKEDNFCYEIEWNLRNLGSIVGATAQKFGIYYSNKKKGYYVAKYWERDKLKDFRIYVTGNEVSVASSLGKDYHVYVVFKPNASRPEIFDLGNPFMEEGKVTLIPINYKLHLKKV